MDVDGLVCEDDVVVRLEVDVGLVCEVGLAEEEVDEGAAFPLDKAVEVDEEGGGWSVISPSKTPPDPTVTFTLSSLDILSFFLFLPSFFSLYLTTWVIPAL